MNREERMAAAREVADYLGPIDPTVLYLTWISLTNAASNLPYPRLTVRLDKKPWVVAVNERRITEEERTLLVETVGEERLGLIRFAPRGYKTRFTCPYCHEKLEAPQIAVQDLSIRATNADELEDANAKDHEIVFSYNGDDEYEGLTYLPDCCELPVRLPVGWTEVGN